MGTLGSRGSMQAREYTGTQIEKNRLLYDANRGEKKKKDYYLG